MAATVQVARREELGSLRQAAASHGLLQAGPLASAHGSWASAAYHTTCRRCRRLPHAGPTSVLDVLLLISPFFFWGTSMVAMKQLAPHTTPLLVASWRLLPAGAALLAWAAASGRKTPTDPRAWLAMALFGLVDGAAFQASCRRGQHPPRGSCSQRLGLSLPPGCCFSTALRPPRISLLLLHHALPRSRPLPPLQGCLVEGLQRTSAGLGSVIIDSQPLTVALLASLLFGEKLGSAGVAGLFIGVAGLFLLEVPPSVLTSLPDSLAGAAFQLASSSGDVGNSAADAAAAAAAAASSSGAADLAAAAAGAAAAGGDSSGSGGGWSLWDSGEWWMLLAAQSMAVGTVMVRWVAKYCDPVVATGWHMLLGGVPLLALAAWQEGAEAPERLAQLTGAAWEAGGTSAALPPCLVPACLPACQPCRHCCAPGGNRPIPSSPYTNTVCCRVPAPVQASMPCCCSTCRCWARPPATASSSTTPPAATSPPSPA